MPFNLPTPISLHTDTAADNVGFIGNELTLRAKTAGNLPMTSGASRVQYDSSGGNAEGVFFGLDGQTALGLTDVTANPSIMIWSLQFNAPNRIQVADHISGGVRFRVGCGADPTLNYREWYIGGNDTPFAASQSGPVTICIDLADTSHEHTVGTFEANDISAYGVANVHEGIVGGQYGEVFFQRSFLLGTDKTSAKLPYFSGDSSFDDAVNLVQGTDYTNKIGSWLTKAGSSFFVPVPFSFGNGSSAITFNDNGASVVSPSSNATNQENFRITNDAMRVYLNTRDNFRDGVTLSGSYNWGTPSAWDFSQDYPSVIADLSGTFTGMGSFTMGRSCYLSGTVSLADGYKLISSGANLDDATINNDVTIETTDVTAYDNLTVLGNVEFTVAGSFSFTDSSIQSFNNFSGGAITITLDNTTLEFPPTDPTITIVKAPRTLTLTGLQPNSEVRIYNANTTTELAGDEDSGALFTTPNITVDSVDIVVHHVSYEYIRIKGANTSNNLSLPIQQQFDRGYRNE